MPQRPPLHPTPLTVGLLLLMAGGAMAEDERWALCPAPAPGPQVLVQSPDVTTISADQAVAQEEDKSVFSGNVVIIRDGRRLEANEAVYDRRNDTLDVRGNVSVFSDDFAFSGENAYFNLGDESGRINAARYRVDSAHAFGSAKSVKFQSGERLKFNDATYTTCPPGSEAWLLDAGTLTLDRGTNTGEARDVSLALGGVPVLYLPYINFPLQGRKSGLLPPISGTSGRNGTDIGVPWYWNISPDRDATFTPRYISARGGMLMTEFRYLNRESFGQLSADVLPNDKLYDGEESKRGMVRFLHNQRFADRWDANVFFQGVSDPAYLNDIDNTLASSSARYLERRVDLNYRGDGWSFLGRVQDFQPLLLAETDYERLPQLLATGTGRAGGLRYDFRTEYVNFESASTSVVTGSRVDLYPAVSLPMAAAAWYVTPRLAGRYTQYELRDALGEPAPSRTLPIASIDSGLFFERELELFHTPLVQTLEPRLYYLYVPYRDQSGLPTFDTDAMTFSFDQLFRENRFTGPDRMGDANQVTAAVTTRFLRDDTGEEALRASLGQVVYFRDHRVVVPGETLEDRHTSDLAGELAARPLPSLEIAGATRWDPDISDARESSARIRYRPDDTRLFDAAWRYRDAGSEMNRDLLVLWPLSRRWQFIGRWYYDLVAERTLESVVGLQYQSCCWSFRAVVRDKPFLTAGNTLESDRSVYFTLELKGLANLGSSLESVIDYGMVGL